MADFKLDEVRRGIESGLRVGQANGIVKLDLDAVPMRGQSLFNPTDRFVHQAREAWLRPIAGRSMSSIRGCIWSAEWVSRATSHGFLRGVHANASTRENLDEAPCEFVDDALLVERENAEAFLLKATCLFQLARDWDALVLLALLRSSKSATPRQLTRAGELREQIRGIYMPWVFNEYGLRIREGRAPEVLDFVRSLAAMEPGVWELFYLEAAALAQLKDFEPALSKADECLQAAPGFERVFLEKFRQSILAQRSQHRMVPAREAYKAAAYPRAHGLLKALDEETRAVPLWITFEKYLSRLIAKKLTPNHGPPEGTAEEKLNLHLFLIETEFAEINRLNREKRSGEAVPIAARAFAFAPYSTDINFTYGVSVYNELIDRLTPNNPARPTNDELDRGLRQAVALFKFAAVDPVLTNAVLWQKDMENLLLIVADNRLLDPLFASFNSIFADLKGKGITSVDDWQRTMARFRAIESDMRGVRPKLNTDGSRKDFDSLNDQVAQCLTQLGAMEHSMRDIEIVNKLYARVNKAAALLERKFPPLQLYELNTIRTTLTQVLGEAMVARHKVHDPVAVQDLDKLIADPVARDRRRFHGGFSTTRY